jgi:hypothetical protein
MWAAVFVTVMVGCAGSNGSVGSSGGSSSGGSSSSSGGSSSSSGGGGSCTIEPQDTKRACVPGIAKANTELSIEIEGTSCAGCGTSFEPCKVSVSGSTITFALDIKRCPLPEGAGCTADCAQPLVSCKVPPLDAGTYRIELARGVKSSDSTPRELVVANANGETACTFAGIGGTQIDPGMFDRSCVTENDCALVVAGDACQLCACPNAAIAKTALASYEAERRERRSACLDQGGTPSCAPCATAKPACVQSKCVITTN